MKQLMKDNTAFCMLAYKPLVCVTNLGLQLAALLLSDNTSQIMQLCYSHMENKLSIKFHKLSSWRVSKHYVKTNCKSTEMKIVLAVSLLLSDEFTVN